MKYEYVIAIKISTDQQIYFKSIPEIIKTAILDGSAVILTAESYESWTEEQAKL